MKLKCVLSLMMGFVVSSLGHEPVSGQEPGHASVAHGIVLLPLDFYLDNAKGLGLSEEQQSEIQRILEGMREPGEKLAAEVNDRTLALHEAVAQNPVEIDKAVERFKAVIQAEDEMKMLQFQVRMKMRAVLTPEQFEKVKTGVAKAGQKGASSGNVVNKLQQIREQINQHFKGEVPQELVSKLNQIEKTARQGHPEEAGEQLDAVLKYLTSGKDAGRDGVKQQFRKLEEALKNTSDPAEREQIEQKMRKLRESVEGGKNSEEASNKGREELEKQMQRIAEMAEHTDNLEVREQLQAALGKLREAAASGNKEVVNDILAAVKKLIQEHPPKP